MIAVLAGTAAADRDSLHGSAAAGGTLVMTGAQGDRFRLDMSLDLKPRSRYGVLLAWRAFDEEHRGLVTAGIEYEGAASRPRLVLDLHADVGFDVDSRRPLGGGGIRTTLMIIGPLALVLDAAAYLIVDGVDHTRLQLQSSTLLGGRW
ncbi:MAG: hypothetical protein H0T46_13045 [Deltaproteobacteria bacterium]|nr:hypothetical protein [Deltaproteobacteria bacterium]